MNDTSPAEFLNEVFQLPATGQEQDWDIELADHTRLQEFITYAQKELLKDDVKQALMALVLASYDDLLRYSGDGDLFYGGQIQQLVAENKPLYSELLTYWARLDENDARNGFYVTPFVRTLL